jgi:hypothetical protein
MCCPEWHGFGYGGSPRGFSSVESVHFADVQFASKFEGSVFDYSDSSFSLIHWIFV